MKALKHCAFVSRCNGADQTLSFISDQSRIKEETLTRARNARARNAINICQCDYEQHLVHVKLNSYLTAVARRYFRIVKTCFRETKIDAHDDVYSERFEIICFSWRRASSVALEFPKYRV